MTNHQPPQTYKPYNSSWWKFIAVYISPIGVFITICIVARYINLPDPLIAFLAYYAHNLYKISQQKSELLKPITVQNNDGKEVTMQAVIRRMNFEKYSWCGLIGVVFLIIMMLPGINRGGFGLDPYYCPHSNLEMFLQD